MSAKPHTVVLGDDLRVRSQGVSRLQGGGYLINVSDIEDDDGLTSKERNSKLEHAIELGSLVELSSGVRAFVVHCGRDCDKTPLYWISLSPQPLFFKGSIYNDRGITHECLWGKLDGGYSEGSVTFIAGPERAYAELEEDGWYKNGKWVESPYYGYEVKE